MIIKKINKGLVIVNIILLLLILLVIGASIANAQSGGNPPHIPPGCDNPIPGIKNPNCDPPDPVPIDGGLSLLALAGGAYAYKKLKWDKRK